MSAMNLKYVVATISLLATGMMASGSPAQAFSFSTNFSGTTDSGGNLDPTRNIMLNSVTLSDGRTISNFALVQSANIISNDTWTGGDTGAASSDRGDNASGIQQEAATNSSIVASLGNLNLNNIIDVEDTGSFKINLSFGQAVSSLFFWERGMNSDLTIQALDQAGNLIGNLFRIDRNTWQNAGFAIDTTEISGAQQVGSRGISVGDLGLTGPIFGIQVSADASHNGPDFKVMGSAEAVPEPTTMAGLALAGAGLAAARRRRSKQTA
jgi:hypothetical protein